MARETKVGLLIGVGVILLIAIIVNDHLVTVGETDEPGHITRFAEAAQDELVEGPGPGTRPAAAVDDRTATERIGDSPSITRTQQQATRDATTEQTPSRRSPMIPTPGEVDGASWQTPRREAPARSIQGLHAAARVEQQPEHLIQPHDVPVESTEAEREERARRIAQLEAQLARAEAERRARLAAAERSPREATAFTAESRETREVTVSPAEVYHYVKPNEALWDIAQQYLGDGSKWKLIAKANPGKVSDNGQVEAGAKLVIPGRDTLAAMTERTTATRGPIDVTPRGGEVPTLYTVKAGDNLYKIAKATLGDGNRYKEIAKLNNLPNANALKLGQKLKIPERAAAPATATESRTARADDARSTRPDARSSRSVGRDTTTARTRSGKTYTVQPGDNLSKIAGAQLGDRSRYDEIFDANRDILNDENDLSVGQVLKIPG